MNGKGIVVPYYSLPFLMVQGHGVGVGRPFDAEASHRRSSLRYRSIVVDRQNRPDVGLSRNGLAPTAIEDFSGGVEPAARPEPIPPSKQSVLEAILFISKEPLSARKLAMLAELSDPTEARTLAKSLNEQYDLQDYSFRIEEVAGGLQLLTRPQFSRWIRRLELAPGEVLLSQGMLETLSIIAYRQPVERAEIEAIRGVSSDEVLRQLMQRDLVRIAGRLEDLGRPYLYGTTRKFLQVFGLQSLEYLPRAQKIREAEAEIASRLADQTPTAQDMAPQRVEE
jgi:segregation and condensation protein B